MAKISIVHWCPRCRIMFENCNSPLITEPKMIQIGTPIEQTTRIKRQCPECGAVFSLVLECATKNQEKRIVLDESGNRITTIQSRPYGEGEKRVIVRAYEEIA